MTDNKKNDTIKQLRINTLTKLFTLLYLYKCPMCGYDLMKNLRRALQRNINPEQIYPFLRKLEESGLAKVIRVEARDKKVYTLTEKGRETVDRLLNRFSDLIQIAISPKVNVCASCGVKIIGEGYKEEIDGETLTFCCKHCARHYKEEKLKFKSRK